MFGAATKGVGLDSMRVTKEVKVFEEGRISTPLAEEAVERC